MMFRKEDVVTVFCGLTLMLAGSSVSADDYYVYSRFDPPGISSVYSCGGYVEDIGVPETWGDEIQYIFFLSGTTGYKFRVWVTNLGEPNDPTPSYIDINQHPLHNDPQHVGPVEPRHFELVSSANLRGYSDGHKSEFHVDSSGIYLGANKYGIHRWDHNWNYIEKIAERAPATETLAYNPGENTWYAGGRNRTVYQLYDDGSWQAIFSYPNYRGSHHDGMEYVGGFLWISDMTSDKIGKWKYDIGTDTWNEERTYIYSEPDDVEGMGFGPCNHFWISSGGTKLYELGGEINPNVVARAGGDVDAWAPNMELEFDASESYHENPDRKIVKYEWDFDGDGTYDYRGPNPVVEHAYPAVLIDPYDANSIDWDATCACYIAKLRVTDDDPIIPKTDMDTRKVCITSHPQNPIADPGGPYNVRVNEEVRLDGSGSFHPAARMYQPGHPWYDDIVLWEWDLDNDGVFETPGEIVSTSWLETGTYVVSLRVTDGTERSDEKAASVIIDYRIHDVAVDTLDLPKKSEFRKGEEVPVNVTVSNVGDYIENFDVTLYCNDDVIDIAHVNDLPPNTVYGPPAFVWNTKDLPEELYTIKACAAVVPGEINVANNCIETTAEVVDLCTLTISSNEGGSVTKPGEDKLPYRSNSVIPIVATPDICFEFIGWTGTAVDAGNVKDPNNPETEVLMDADHTLIAQFAFENLPDLSSEDGGYIRELDEVDLNLCEKWFFFEAIAEPCYKFTRWGGSAVDDGIVSPYDPAIDLQADKKYTLKAYFEPTMIEDDFELYNDIDPNEPGSNRIFEAWDDGYEDDTNGALVGNDLPPYAERRVVHDGRQSMPYSYDNNMKISEATKTIDCPCDWIEAGAGLTMLSLWFRGSPANSPEPMFFAINGDAVVYHDDPAVTQIAVWTEWSIELQAFADQGADLRNVDTITIGFGVKNAPTAGGKGKVYFDDIRLLRPAEQPHLSGEN